MGRAKKRLQKKQPVKKVVRRTPHVQQENKLTPEQKARENEMIKAMLIARPATQINPGLTQQNDKMQHQIDMLNKRLIEESNKTEAKKQEKQAVESRITQEASAREQIQNEINALKEEHKSKRKLLNVQQQGKDTKDEYEEKIDALQRELDKLDETTEQGKVIAEMERIKAETREIKRKIEDADRQIKSNELFGELQNVRTKNKKAKAERENAIKDMRSGKEHILFSSFGIAREGLDIPRLDRLFLIAPTKNKAALIQSTGRIERTFEGKDECIVYDFVDINEIYYARAWKARKTIYKGNGNLIIDKN